jgi:hypothetical protein
LWTFTIGHAQKYACRPTSRTYPSDNRVPLTGPEMAGPPCACGREGFGDTGAVAFVDAGGVGLPHAIVIAATSVAVQAR